MKDRKTAKLGPNTKQMINLFRAYTIPKSPLVTARYPPLCDEYTETTSRIREFDKEAP